jgi:hypothetical protein
MHNNVHQVHLNCYTRRRQIYFRYCKVCRSRQGIEILDMVLLIMPRLHHFMKEENSLSSLFSATIQLFDIMISIGL